MPTIKMIEKYFIEMYWPNPFSRSKDRPFVKFKHFRIGCYQGRLSIIITLKEDKSAQFLYYNLVTMTNKHKRALGEDIKVAMLLQCR
jgi:hypothetical protein